MELKKQRKNLFLKDTVYEFSVKDGFSFYGFSSEEIKDAVYFDNSLVSGFFEHFLGHYFCNLTKTHRTCHYDFVGLTGEKYELKFAQKHKQKIKSGTIMSKAVYFQTGYYRLKSITKEKKEEYLKKQKDIDYFMIADISTAGMINLYTLKFKQMKEHLQKENPTQIRLKEVQLLTKQNSRFRIV